MKATQIGGTHYGKDGAYQHWDWAMDVRLGYFESAASKYTFRWYKKNGVEDLDKARSYLLKAKEGFLAGRWDNNSLHVDTYPLCKDRAESMFNTFIESAEVPQIEAELCSLIAQWRNDVDLAIIIGKLGVYIDAARAIEDSGGTLGPLLPLMTPVLLKTGGSGRAAGATTQRPASSASTEVGINHPAPFGYVPGDL